ncbi:MAG: hypothetical protein ACHQ5A_00100, partial [Opitutales bacterium]
MPPSPSPADPLATNRPWFGRLLIFLLLLASTYTYPNPPAIDLDASWRMALGKFLLDGLQFGRDVVFTYGPLGFVMGNTYYGSGFLYHSLLVWQLFAAVCFALVIMMWGERLSDRPRFFYYAFFVLFGT